MKHSLAACLLLLASSMMLAACSAGDDGQARTGETATQQVALRLCFPTGDAVTRAPGDPGETETLAPPTIAYIYFVNSSGSVVALEYNNNGTPTPMPRKVTLADFFGSPQTVTYGGRLSATGDQVYQFYDAQKTLTCPADGRFYIVASNEPLKQGGTPLEDVAVTTESQVQALTFDLYNDDMKADLKNVYSSPYNYIIGGKYYGTTVADAPVEMMLYHVAARVDVKWNVTNGRTDNFQSMRKVAAMTVGGLKSRDCSIFKPMANTSLGSEPYTVTLKTASEVGSQWYGRAAFYTVPYSTSGHFAMQLDVNNGSADNSTTLSLNMAGADPVFVPWIRVNLTYDEDSDFTTVLEL